MEKYVNLLKQLIATPSMSREEQNAAQVIRQFFVEIFRCFYRFFNIPFCYSEISIILLVNPLLFCKRYVPVSYAKNRFQQDNGCGMVFAFYPVRKSRAPSIWYMLQ